MDTVCPYLHTHTGARINFSTFNSSAEISCPTCWRNFLPLAILGQFHTTRRTVDDTSISKTTRRLKREHQRQTKVPQHQTHAPTTQRAPCRLNRSRHAPLRGQVVNKRSSHEMRDVQPSRSYILQDGWRLCNLTYTAVTRDVSQGN